MRRTLPLLLLFLAASFAAAQPGEHPPGDRPDWQAQVLRDLPLLGHRNWILVVDSAYPLQTSEGVETVETNADQLEVARFVLHAIGRSIHVRPEVMMDAELPFVPESDAPGVSQYRTEIHDLLAGEHVESVPHEQLIHRVNDDGKLVHVLVLKTRLAVPYTSLFIRLNCKYWSDDAEHRLRAKMSSETGSR
ncbi:MAG TPA: RbsD/FucU domain-containing protein [Terracidiphilus sp.]|nr:RbsD/FucU domain-containing protein [Terracidiphilus sp.]